jgi:hypothetical protein
MKRVFTFITIMTVALSFSLGFANTGFSETGSGTLPSFKTVSENGVTLSARMLPKEFLVNEYGEKSNPFLTLGLRSLTVLEVKVTADTESRLLSESIVLDLGKESLKPISPMRIKNYWRRKLKNNRNDSYTLDRYRGWSYGKTNYRIRQNVLPARKTLVAGSEHTFYMVFPETDIDSSIATLYIPVFNKGGGALSEVSVDIRM